METLTHITLVTLTLIIVHGVSSEGQVSEDEVVANGQSHLANGQKKSITVPFSMVPEATFNSNILVRPRLLFARTRASPRDSGVGDFLDELESKKHETYVAPILEEEEDEEEVTAADTNDSGRRVLATRDRDAWVKRRIDHHRHHHPHRLTRDRVKRHRLISPNKGKSNRHRLSSDEEDEDEEITQPSEIDEVDEVKENRRFVRAKHRNAAPAAHMRSLHESKYKSPSKSVRNRRARGYKKMRSKIDDELIEVDSEPDDIEEMTESTSLQGNEAVFDSERITPLSLKQVQPVNSQLIPNLLSKSYETYSPDSTSAISSYVSRLRDDLNDGKAKYAADVLKSKVEEDTKSVEKNSSKMPWIPLPSVDEVDYPSDHLAHHQQSSDKVNSIPFGVRRNSYKINSRPAFRADEAAATGHQIDRSPVTRETTHAQLTQPQPSSAIPTVSSANISSSASSFNPIAVQHSNHHHLLHSISDRITDRLYSRGLLVYLKDFKYGGL